MNARFLNSFRVHSLMCAQATSFMRNPLSSFHKRRISKHEEDSTLPARLPQAGVASSIQPPNELSAKLASSSSSGNSPEMSQGKLTTEMEELPVDRKARLRARKLSLTEGDELYAGAKGTKDAPGRSFSVRPKR